MDVRVICDVVSVVFERRRIEGKKPDGRNAEVLQIIEFLGKPGEIAYSVIIAVEECANMKFVDDRVLVPERIVFERKGFTAGHDTNLLFPEYMRRRFMRA